MAPPYAEMRIEMSIWTTLRLALAPGLCDGRGVLTLFLEGLDSALND